MRRGSLPLILGVALLLVGAGLAWYYATTVYPAQKSQFENGCSANRVPCALFAPASDQGPYLLGEFLVALGAILAFFGGVRVALGTLRHGPPPRIGP